MINPGDMNRAINILTLTAAGSVYTWAAGLLGWAKVEPEDRTNLFSKVGIGVRTVKFTLWKQNLTMHQAIKYQGAHHFITNITERDRLRYEVKTAKIEPKTCVATRNITIKNELNRPVRTPQTVATFPGCLTEKYLGYRQEQPQAVNELLLVLVTPKIIVLQVGDMVQIDADKYNVQIPHTLDDFKNEYEIALTKDV